MTGKLNKSMFVRTHASSDERFLIMLVFKLLLDGYRPCWCVSSFLYARMQPPKLGVAENKRAQVL